MTQIRAEIIHKHLKPQNVLQLLYMKEKHTLHVPAGVLWLHIRMRVILTLTATSLDL